jgi:septal ring factor EnvC (AmiA/AmiB activator)
MPHALIEPPTTWLGFVVEVIAALAVIAFVGFTLYYQRGRAQRLDTSEALMDWKEIAEARGTKLKDGDEEKSNLAAELKRAKEDLDACEKLRDDWAQHNLRLQAREVRYQAAINRLERQAGLRETDFNDPTRMETL